MAGKNKAVNAGIWYIIGNMMLKGIIFITLPLFTRILSTSDYGYYNTYVAYETIVTGIIGMGLYGSIKNAKLDFKEAFEGYLSSIVFLGTIVMTVVTMVANLTFGFYDTLFGFDRFVLNCLILHSFGSFVIQIYNAKLNMEFKYKSFIAIASVNTVSNIVISVLLIYGVFPEQRYVGRILGYALPPVLIGVILTVLIWKKGNVLYSRKYWLYGLAIGMPLVPHVLSQTVLAQFDRVMIKNIVGASESGIYSFMYTISTILYIVQTSLDSAWTPWMFYRLDNGEGKQIREKAKYYILVFSILTVGFMCVIPEVIKIMASSDYWEGTSLMVPLSLCIFCMFLYTLPVNIEYFHKKTSYISAGTLSAALVNIVLNYFCITYYGYEMAAYTTLFSYILLFIFHLCIAKRFKFLEYYDLKNIIVSAGCVFAIGAIIRITGENWIVRYAILMVVLAACICNRKKIISILKEIKSN